MPSENLKSQAQAVAQAVVADPDEDGAVVLHALGGGDLHIRVVTAHEGVKPANLTTMLRRLVASVVEAVGKDPGSHAQLVGAVNGLGRELETLDGVVGEALGQQNIRMKAIEGRLLEVGHLRQRLDALEARVDVQEAAGEAH